MVFCIKLYKLGKTSEFVNKPIEKSDLVFNLVRMLQRGVLAEGRLVKLRTPLMFT